MDSIAIVRFLKNQFPENRNESNTFTLETGRNHPKYDESPPPGLADTAGKEFLNF